MAFSPTQTGVAPPAPADRMLAVTCFLQFPAVSSEATTTLELVPNATNIIDENRTVDFRLWAQMRFGACM